jgi:hypothetical protein
MTHRIPENFSAAEWRLVTIMGNTMPPRDPTDDDDDDEDGYTFHGGLNAEAQGAELDKFGLVQFPMVMVAMPLGQGRRNLGRGTKKLLRQGCAT